MNSFSGGQLLQWARHSAQVLHQRREEINALNVFPVPDSDTGSNMAYTMRAAVEYAEKELSNHPDLVRRADRVAEALSLGAVRGARGNSGVVLSQVLRALAQSASADEISGEHFARALSTAVAYVTRAITEPVEGTVLTVLRAASIAASAVESTHFWVVVQAATTAAKRALANTPSQLSALRDAGVVDAGGQGLVILLDCLTTTAPYQGQQPEVFVEHAPVPSQPEVSRTSSEYSASDLARQITALGGQQQVEEATCSPEPADTSTDYLEVMFFIQDCDLEDLRSRLRPLGDSLLIAPLGLGSATVHIHSYQAGTVIETAIARGQVSELRLEVLPDFGHSQERRTQQVLAITPPGNVATLFTQAGALVLTKANEVDDICTEIASLVHRRQLGELILLSNGMLSHFELAQTQRLVHAVGCAFSIVPSSTLLGGYLALSVYQPQQPLALATCSMVESLQSVHTRRLSYAAQGYVSVHAGGYHVDWEDALIEHCQALLRLGGKQLTVFIDNEIGEDCCQQLLAKVLDNQTELSVYAVENLGCLAEIGVE